jgi:hypothetical protein
MRKITVRVFVIGFLFLSMFCVVATFASIQVTAQEGTWTQSSPGQGMVIGTHPGSCLYNVQMTLSQSGSNSYTGSLQANCIDVDETAGYEGQLQFKIGESTTYSASGSLNGNIFTLTLSNWEGTFSYPLTFSPGSLSGSDTYSDSTGLEYDYSFDLVGGSGSGSSNGGGGLLDISPLAASVAALGFIGGVAGLAASKSSATKGLGLPSQPRRTPRRGPVGRIPSTPRSEPLPPQPPPAPPPFYEGSTTTSAPVEPGTHYVEADPPGEGKPTSGIGVHTGPVDKMPPPDPPRGDEFGNEYNPKCRQPNCGLRTDPVQNADGSWRWRCPNHEFPWG